MNVPVRAQGKVDANGIGEVFIKVPGKFSALDPADPNFSGRTVSSAEICLGAQAAGDAILSLTQEDRDSILIGVFGSVEAVKKFFPEYPILGDWKDEELPAENQGFYFNASECLKLEPPPSKGKVISGMYLVVKIQKVIPVTDMVYANIFWNAPDTNQAGTANTPGAG